MISKKFATALIFFSFVGSFAMAAEPSYCDPANFKNLEVKYTSKSKPSNLHVYKIGGLTLAGMAVGNSKLQDVIDLAQTYSSAGAADKYCTWYLNDGNSQASKAFAWHYVPRPTGSDLKGMGNIYMNALGEDFDQANVSFVSCAVNQGYVGMGCDGMKHRGPSVFAMLLAYSGCSPEHAATIATQIWGNNGVTTEMRAELGRRAIAGARPQFAEMLRKVMEAPIR
jgi:hypothetical protein